MSTTLAILTPIFPQNTGVADYATGLVSGLREKELHVDVYAPSQFIYNNKKHFDKCYPISKFVFKQYKPEHTIYQIGNNQEFHDETLLYFLQYGGIAHLHDLCLHDIFSYFTYFQNTEIYYALLQKWYGDSVTQKIRDYHLKHLSLYAKNKRSYFWESKYVLDYPLNEEVLDRAVAVIVHSEFAKASITNKFPNKAVYVIPQRYPSISAKRHHKTDRLKICSMGFVAPNKCIDKEIEAVAFCREAGVDVQLDIVGRLHPQCQDLPKLCTKLGVADLVTFHGLVRQEVFSSFFANSDVVVVLRDPTVGETSAVAMQALQFGIPLIVNAVGSYAELPRFVKKIPQGASASRILADILFEFATAPNRYDEISSAAFAYAAREGTFDTGIEQYIAALEAIEKASKSGI